MRTKNRGPLDFYGIGSSEEEAERIFQELKADLKSGKVEGFTILCTKRNESLCRSSRDFPTPPFLLPDPDEEEAARLEQERKKKVQQEARELAERIARARAAKGIH